MTQPKFAVILPAAGQSSRFKHPHYKKAFAPLRDKAVWLHSVDRFIDRADVVQMIVAIATDDREYFMGKYAANLAIHAIQVVEGGPERSDTIERALALVRSDIEYVCIHDVARPCLSDLWIESVFQKAIETGAAILAAPVTSTLKRVGPAHVIQETVPRDHLWEAQTPQVFRRELLLQAYALRGGKAATDDALLVERLGHPVAVVPCSIMNLKITTQADLKLAERVLDCLPRPKLNSPLHPFHGLG